MTHFIHEKLGYGAGQIRATVIGGHGDYMVPLIRYSTVAGIPLSDLLSYEDISDIINRTKHGGAEIVGLLGTSAYFAPGKSAAIIVEAVLKDSKKIYPCATLLNGEYGYNDVVNGVPVMLGRNGVEKIIEVSLNETEKAQFAKSVESVQDLINVLKEKEFIKE
jgi:malate dehydrogenase